MSVSLSVWLKYKPTQTKVDIAKRFQCLKEQCRLGPELVGLAPTGQPYITTIQGGPQVQESHHRFEVALHLLHPPILPVCVIDTDIG